MRCLTDYERRVAGLIDYSRWLSGGTDAKKALMNSILQFTNEYFGMETELFFDMPEGFEAANGLTDPDTGNISVNEALFGGHDAFLPLFIFLHELRHGIQQARTELFSKEIAMNCAHIIQFDGTGYSIRGKDVITVKMEGTREFYTELYLGSPVEMDANRFAYEMLRPVCDDEALEEHYRIWTPSYTIIPKERMLEEFINACKQIDMLAERQTSKA